MKGHKEVFDTDLQCKIKEHNLCCWKEKRGLFLHPTPLAQQLDVIQCKTLCSAGCFLQVLWNCDARALYADEKVARPPNV